MPRPRPPGGSPTRRWTRMLLTVAFAMAAIGDAPSVRAGEGSIGGAIGGGSGGSAGGSIGGGGGGGGSGGGSGGSIGGKIAPTPEAAPAPAPSKSESRSEPKEKSTRREERPRARRSRDAARDGGKRREGGGGGGFDGSWTVHTVTNCGATSTGTMRVSHGRISARNAYGSTRGSVSPSGHLHAVGHYAGQSQYTSGQLSGSSGSGSFRRGDGCRGSWTASR